MCGINKHLKKIDKTRTTDRHL